MRLTGVIVALALLGAACDTASSPFGSTTTPSEELTTTSLRTEPGGTSSDPGTTSSTAIDTVEPEPEVSTFVGGEAPIFGPRDQDWNANFVVPGPIIESDGIFHMFYVGHALDRPNITRGQVGLATSADGRDWAFVNTEPLFDASEYEWTEAGVYPTTGQILEDGTWALWFSVVPRSFTTRAVVIGRATAPGPNGPWTVDPEPVLAGGGEGTWNEKGVSHPSVLKTDGGYVMYFDGHINDIDVERDRAIGMALSEDAEQWTLYNDPETGGLYEASDPVFRPGAEDAWDAARVMLPSVLHDGERFVMVYLSSWRRTDRPGFLQDIGYATSDDGVSWTRGESNPLLENNGTIAFVTNASTWLHNDRLNVYYDVFGNLGATLNGVFMMSADLSDL